MTIGELSKSEASIILRAKVVDLSYLGSNLGFSHAARKPFLIVGF